MKNLFLKNSNGEIFKVNHICMCSECQKRGMSESYMFDTGGSCLNIMMDNGKPIFQFMSTEEAVKRIVSKGFIVVGYPAETFIKNE